MAHTSQPPSSLWKSFQNKSPRLVHTHSCLSLWTRELWTLNIWIKSTLEEPVQVPSTPAAFVWCATQVRTELDQRLFEVHFPSPVPQHTQLWTVNPDLADTPGIRVWSLASHPDLDDYSLSKCSWLWIKGEDFSELNSVISNREDPAVLWFWESTSETHWGESFNKTGKKNSQGETLIANFVCDMKHCYWVIKN